VLKLTLATRADRKGRYTVKFAATGEAAAGSVTLRLATGSRRRVVLRLKKKDLALLKRKRRLRVTLTASMTDLAGNTAKATKTLNLRLKR
jgi:hypothetical protein